MAACPTKIWTDIGCGVWRSTGGLVFVTRTGSLWHVAYGDRPEEYRQCKDNREAFSEGRKMHKLALIRLSEKREDQKIGEAIWDVEKRLNAISPIVPPPRTTRHLAWLV